MSEQNGNFETPEKCRYCPYLRERLAEFACVATVTLNQPDQRLAARDITDGRSLLYAELKQTTQNCRGRDEYGDDCGRAAHL